MAAISYGILFARESVWDSLSEKAQDNLSEYLYAINEYALPECNWVLFAVLVNLALKSVGRKHSREKLEKYLELTESFYIGDGWYRDGDSNQKDYYILFCNSLLLPDLRQAYGKRGCKALGAVQGKSDDFCKAVHLLV